MSVIGTIQAFNEEDAITGAIESLYAAGCDRVVVVDGAWGNPDGTLFGNAATHLSTDGTCEAARAAGAEYVEPEYPFWAGDKSKRDYLLTFGGPGDHLILLDADERLEGTIDEEACPAGHGCIVLHNDKPNDLAIRTPWLDRDVRASVPMLRWFRWSPTLTCLSPGHYRENGKPIHVYLVEALAAAADEMSPLELAALAALRSIETKLPNKRLSILPIVQGIEIRHSVEATTDRIAAKRIYYEAPE
ncbi:MAG TPA: hypothetical protein VH063_18880 [Gaiellaceae bacterium]|nr:hypothetical protein [Gaiellaceae bacterium]